MGCFAYNVVSEKLEVAMTLSSVEKEGEESANRRSFLASMIAFTNRCQVFTLDLVHPLAKIIVLPTFSPLMSTL